jgi:hypothetical protein
MLTRLSSARPRSFALANGSKRTHTTFPRGRGRYHGDGGLRMNRAKGSTTSFTTVRDGTTIMTTAVMPQNAARLQPSCADRVLRLQPEDRRKEPSNPGRHDGNAFGRDCKYGRHPGSKRSQPDRVKEHFGSDHACEWNSNASRSEIGNLWHGKSLRTGARTDPHDGASGRSTHHGIQCIDQTWFWRLIGQVGKPQSVCTSQCGGWLLPVNSILRTTLGPRAQFYRSDSDT